MISLQRLLEALARFGRVGVVGDVLVRRAAQHARHDPPAGHHVEHGELLGHADRVQDRDVGAEQRDLGPLDPLGQRAGHHHRVGRQRERRVVVLGHGHPVEADLVGQLELLQARLHRLDWRRLRRVRAARRRPDSRWAPPCTALD